VDYSSVIYMGKYKIIYKEEWLVSRVQVSYIIVWKYVIEIPRGTSYTHICTVSVLKLYCVLTFLF